MILCLSAFVVSNRLFCRWSEDDGQLGAAGGVGVFAAVEDFGGGSLGFVADKDPTEIAFG